MAAGWLAMFLLPLFFNRKFDFLTPYPTHLMLFFYTVIPVWFLSGMLHSSQNVNTPYIIKIKLSAAVLSTWAVYLVLIAVCFLFAIGKVSVGRIFGHIGYMMLYTFIIYAISVLAFSITMTKSAMVLSAFVIVFGIFLVLESLFTLFNIFFSTVYFSTEELFVLSLSPYTRFMILDLKPLQFWPVVMYILFFSAVMALSIWLFTKQKKNEKNGAFAFTTAKAVIKYVLFFSMEILIGYFCYQIGGVMLMMIFYVIFLVVFQLIFETMITGHMSMAFKNYKGFLIYTALFGVLILLVSNDAGRFDSFVPTAQQVKSVKFMLGNGDDRIQQMGATQSDLFRDTDIYKFSEEESIRQVVDIVQKIVDVNGFSRKRMVNGFVEDDSFKVANETYFDLSVEYKLSSGLTVLRKYKDVAYSNIYDEFQALYSLPEYRTKNPIFYFEEEPNMLIVDNQVIEDPEVLKQLPQLIDGLKADLYQKSFDSLLHMPFAEINFEIVDGKKIKSSLGITIYPDFINTVNFLEGLGMGRKEPESKDVVAAYVYDCRNIVNYVTITPSNFEMFSSSLPEPVKLTNPNEIGTLLKDAVLVAEHRPQSPYLLFDKNYVVVPEFKPGAIDRKALYFFSKDGVPDQLPLS